MKGILTNLRSGRTTMLTANMVILAFALVGWVVATVLAVLIAG